ncbi:MAG: phenylpyruvate tautomerase MIF-related protein [Promethearchaeota archaeon]
MPAVFVESNLDFPDPEALARELSKTVAFVLNKPESYVTVSIRKSIAITRGGIPAKFALVEVRSIGGLNLSVNDQLSKDISVILINYGFEPDMIDLNFKDVAPENWGKSTGTFGK